MAGAAVVEIISLKMNSVVPLNLMPESMVVTKDAMWCLTLALGLSYLLKHLLLLLFLL